jgi:hypothetical protein
VEIDCGFRDGQSLRDFLIAIAIPDEQQHLQLATG